MLDKYKIRKVLKIMITILLPIYLILMLYYIPTVFIFSIILGNITGIAISIFCVIVAIFAIIIFLELYDLL